MANALKIDPIRRDAVESEVLSLWKKGIEEKLGSQNIALTDLYLVEQLPQLLEEVCVSLPEQKKPFQWSPHFFEAKLQQLLIEFTELRAALETTLEKNTTHTKDEIRIILSYLDRKMSESILSVFADMRETYQGELIEAQSHAERYKFAAVSGRSYFWEWDSLTGQVWRSPGFDELHGQKKVDQNLTLEDFFLLILPEDREEAKHAIWKAQDERRNRFQFKYRTLEGGKGVKYLKASGYLYRDPHGKLIRMAGIVVDTKRSDKKTPR
jgi:PAS domain-containing protein